MMKKCAAMLLCIVMLLVLVACGDTAAEESDTKNNEIKDSQASEAESRDTENVNTENQETESEEDLTELPDGEGEEIEVNYEDQISLIIGNRDLWEIPSEEYYQPYSYAVTDLDQNGRLELIVSVCMGTGFYTYTDVWQVNEAFDALELCETDYEEYDSQADIITEQTKAYTDGDTIYYIFTDWTRSGWAWNGERKIAYWLSDGRIAEISIATYSQENFEDGSSVVVYQDMQSNDISEADYENAEAEMFADLDELDVAILWQMYEESEFNQMDDTALYDAFVASWEGFYVG